MRQLHLPSPSVIVGVDGSRASVQAALWAVDEAVSRDVPLRLICAIAPDTTNRADHQREARKLAVAELALHYAFMTVEATEKPVKIELEVAHGGPVPALIRASGSAALMSLGAIGTAHFAPSRVGSTAVTLASSAHCPVAIIRGRDLPLGDRGTILVYVGRAPDASAVFQAAFEEARLRGLPVQAVTAWQSRLTDVHDHRVVSEGNREVQAHLDRLLHPWARRHPDIDISSVAVHGTLVNHLAQIKESVRLLVIGTHDCDAVQIVGPEATAVLHRANCSVLITGNAHL